MSYSFLSVTQARRNPPFLTTDPVNKLAVSFILTRSDYCNSLLAGLPDNKLNKHHLQNNAARLVLHKSSHVRATSLLRTLHWLPVKARVQCKIACIYFSVSVITLCHLIFLTFFIHTIHLGRCTLLTPLCLQYLASVSKPLAHYLELPTFISLKKTQCFSTSKRTWKLISLKCISVEICKWLCVLFNIYVFVCVCVCACVRVCVHVCARVCACAHSLLCVCVM